MSTPRTADEISVELSARRTGMSFQRTRMSADRTLMSAIRTSFSLVSFGFTIHQAFKTLREQHVVAVGHAPRTFAGALVLLGVGMMCAGVVFHLQFMFSLRHLREAMKADGLIHGESRFPVSYTLVIAVLVLVMGVAAVLGVTLGLGPLR